MKILYVTARWDPQDPDSGAGENFSIYTSLKAWAEEIKIAGPFNVNLTLVERALTRLASLFTQKRLIKFYPSYIRYSNSSVEKIMQDYVPDVIVSKASIPLVNVNLTAPLVYMCDSTVKWVKGEWPHFSKLGFHIMERWERKVINKADHILTFSHANADVLINDYGKHAHQISIHPMPSSLPENLCGDEKRILSKNEPIHLLLVGKTYHGKGVDIAIEATRLSNRNGIPTLLRIVGQDGEDEEFVQFAGMFSKKDPQQLQKYIENYRWTHFLILPSRFDAAGIVPSEAAGFGVPTITNASGGLATTVKDRVSGIVLEKNSPPDAYAAVLKNYWNNPEEYHSLRQSTFNRYQSELKWDVLSKRLIEIIHKAVQAYSP